MEALRRPAPKYQLSQLYFYLSKGCNLRCRHCWIVPESRGESWAGPFLDMDLFESILEQAMPLGLTTAKLTGGEPLIHPHIAEILKRLRRENIRMVMETNGVCLTPKLAELIKVSREPFVSISLDGVDAETHEWVRGVRGCFSAAVEGIRNLVNVGLRPQVIMSVMRRNRDQIRPLVELAESLGAGSVKFNIVQPTSRGQLLHEQGDTLSIRELVELGTWIERELRPSVNIKVFYSHPAAFRPLSRMFGDNGDGAGVCGVFSIVGVLGDGTYALCGIGESVEELIFGHAAKDRLLDIWLNNPVLTKIRQGLPRNLEGVCNRCVVKNFCLGNCIAQNYYTSRNLWAPFWYCERALEEGLFPENRLVMRRVREDKDPSDLEGLTEQAVNR